MVRLAVITLAAVAVSLASFWALTRPVGDREALPENYRADGSNGERLYRLGACAACHELAEAEDSDRLGGGKALATPYGTFRLPNISPHPVAGIGRWSDREFIDAMKYGISPQGSHYYPAFPYASYTRMTIADLLDLKAYLETLPVSDNEVGRHILDFPWNLRRGVGLWKRLYMDPQPVLEFAQVDPALLRGRYLVEGPGHCAECHTPRSALGGLDRSRWMAGAPQVDGEGRVPNITPHADGIGDWSQADLRYYFESGFRPDFDTVGGTMVAVQENIADLPETDREAIARYLMALPAKPGPND